MWALIIGAVGLLAALSILAVEVHAPPAGARPMAASREPAASRAPAIREAVARPRYRTRVARPRPTLVAADPWAPR